MKKLVILLLALLLCVAMPMAVFAAEEGQGFGEVESVTAPRLYGETEDPGQGFEGYDSVTAPKVYEGDDTGMSGGTLAAIIVGAVAVVAMLTYFVLRRKK